MNWPEQRLWQALRKLDAHIHRQAPIGPYVADFACRSKRLAIEVEGGVHERLPDVALRDFERTAWLEGQGYRVLRFSDRRIRNEIDAVVDEVRKALSLPLDGGGRGGGAGSVFAGRAALGAEPSGAKSGSAPTSPPSPTLPPCRGKGDETSL